MPAGDHNKWASDVREAFGDGWLALVRITGRVIRRKLGQTQRKSQQEEASSERGQFPCR